MHDVNMSEYESPIQLIIHEIQEQREKEMWTQMYKVLESYEIKVDKVELIKALSYDRKQYEKGYENGYKDGKLDAMNYIEDAPTIDAIPREKWKELKETIIEMRDSGGTAAQNVVCKFLTNLMEILEKEGKNDGSD